MRVNSIGNAYFGYARSNSETNKTKIENTTDLFLQSPSFKSITINDATFTNVVNEKDKAIIEKMLNDTKRKYEDKTENLDVRARINVSEHGALFKKYTYHIHLFGGYKDIEQARDTILRNYEENGPDGKYLEPFCVLPEHIDGELESIKKLEARDPEIMDRMNYYHRILCEPKRAWHKTFDELPKNLDDAMERLLNDAAVLVPGYPRRPIEDI